MDVESRSPDCETTNATSQDAKSASPEPPNGEYGWVVVFGSFLIHVMVLGNVYSFGVFFPVLADAFDASLGTTAWIGSIGFGVLAGLASFSGKWADQFGNSRVAFAGGLVISLAYFLASLSTQVWHLFLSLGVLAGIGYSLAYVAGVSVVSQWFSTRRGLAVGMAVSGSGLGQFAVALTTGALIDKFRWRGALQYLSLISLIGITISSILIRRLLPCFVFNKSESALHFFRERNFTLIYASVFFGSLGTGMQYTHITTYAILHGLTTSQATLLVALMGVASAIGRIVLGYLGDTYGKIRMFQACFVFAAIITFCWIACTTFPSLIFFALAFGFFGGGMISLIPAVCAILCGLDRQGNAYGLLLTATAIGNLLSSPIAGFIFGAYGAYYPAILVAGAFVVLACGFVAALQTDEAIEISQKAAADALRDDAPAKVSGFERSEDPEI